MLEVSKSDLSSCAINFHENSRNWHYHLLTPNCQFNNTTMYALLLEDVDTEEAYVYYSDEAEAGLSKVLATMLHGNEVMARDQPRVGYMSANDEQHILDFIDQLDAVSAKWHHHVFFPGCMFGTNSTKFELVLEDPKSDNRLVSVSDDEPKEVLKQVEARFYKQNQI